MEIKPVITLEDYNKDGNRERKNYIFDRVEIEGEYAILIYREVFTLGKNIKKGTNVGDDWYFR